MTFKHMQNFPGGDRMNGSKRGIILVLIAGIACWVNAIPVVIGLDVVPLVDTVTAGDSVTFFGAVIDNMDMVHHEFDTCIHWNIIPADTRNKLSVTMGSQTTYYAVEAYRWNFIVASFTDPMNGRMLFDADTIYIKPPPMTCRLLIEPDTNINPADRSAASLARLLYPDKVPLISFDNSNSSVTVAAVVRDPYGNFIGFCKNAIWRVIGDTGVLKLSQPDKPYLCRIERTVWGHVGVTLSDDSSSIPDAVPVYVPACCEMWKIRLVNAENGQQIDSIALNLGEEITLNLEGKSSVDTTRWIDVMGKWSLSPSIPSDSPVPAGEAGTWKFSPLAAGDAMLTVTVWAGIRMVAFPLNIQVHVVSNLKLLVGRSRIFVSRKKEMAEYYNLRGQKLPLRGIRHADGIVLERIIQPDGKANFRKIIPEIKSR